MNTITHDILTIEEAADYLRVPVSTVYRLAQSSRLPAQKIGRQWRFYRPQLIQFMVSKGLTADQSDDDRKQIDFS